MTLTNSKLLKILRENDCDVSLSYNEDLNYCKWCLSIYKYGEGLIRIDLTEEEYNDILEEEYS